VSEPHAEPQCPGPRWRLSSRGADAERFARICSASGPAQSRSNRSASSCVIVANGRGATTHHLNVCPASHDLRHPCPALAADAAEFKNRPDFPVKMHAMQHTGCAWQDTGSINQSAIDQDATWLSAPELGPSRNPSQFFWCWATAGLPGVALAHCRQSPQCQVAKVLD